MLKILLATSMLIPSALLIKPKYLFSIMIAQAMIITLLMLKWLEQPLNYAPRAINTWMALDSITTPLTLLSAWILPLMIMASQHLMMNEPLNRKRTFLALCATLQTTLILAFTALDLMMFYVMFEATLLPTLIMITRWGSQTERLSAGTYFLFYTLAGSLPLLVIILVLGTNANHMVMFLFAMMKTELPLTNSNLLIWLACTMAFMVKMPLYGLHLWLPKAHVEAPIAGSMILAAVLLKLGGYGIIRMSPILSPATLTMCYPFVVLSLWGMVMTSLICLRQTDLKSIIAYSSVSHMGLVIAATMIQTPWSMTGAMVLMISHGLTSSMLFCLANTNYERTHTRTLLLTRGLTIALPLMTLWWFLASLMNLALPPTINLLAELMVIASMFNWAALTLILSGTTTLLTAVYSLYIFLSTQHGQMPMHAPHAPSHTREHLLMVLHLTPLMLLITHPTLIF